MTSAMIEADDHRVDASEEVERASVGLRVRIDSPFLDEIVDDDCHPDDRIVCLLLRPVRMAEHHDKIVLGLDTNKRVLVLWKHLEEIFPAIQDHLPGSMDIPIAIDERVVVGHETGKSVQVLIVDALVELERNEFGISYIHEVLRASNDRITPPASSLSSTNSIRALASVLPLDLITTRARQRQQTAPAM